MPLPDTAVVSATFAATLVVLTYLAVAVVMMSDEMFMGKRQFRKQVDDDDDPFERLISPRARADRLRAIRKNYRRLSNPQPTDADANDFMIRLMEQTIYGAQYKYRQLEANIESASVPGEKAKQLQRQRLAFIFTQLRYWENEMKIMVANGINRSAKGYESKDNDMTWYLYNYEHILRRHVDISYTVDYLIEFFYEILPVTWEPPVTFNLTMKSANKKKQKHPPRPPVKR